MTTYLATYTYRQHELRTSTFCSAECRLEYFSPERPRTERDSTSYEFLEVCANCGVEIPAAALPSTFEPLGSFFGYDRDALLADTETGVIFETASLRVLEMHDLEARLAIEATPPIRL
jgi:hypothetical protein